MSDSRSPEAPRLAFARRDEGFTLVEIVMSLALFMIIFVGVMTFMQANLISSARASTRAKATNVAASYIEQVRAMPYDTIGNVSGNPSGTLTEQTFTQGGITYVISPTVAWIDDATINGPGGVSTTHDYKVLTVTVTATSANGMTASYTLQAIISKAAGTATATALPTVDFDDLSPVKGEYVSKTVHVGAIAQANATGATITNLNMYADDSQKGLLISPGLTVAQWPPLAWSNTTFLWDTTSVDTSGVPHFPDGPHNLTLQVFDSLGKVAFVVRPIYIVNNAPAVPVPTLVGASSTTLTATWPVCRSGAIDAARYEWAIYDQNSGSGAWQVQESPWTGFVNSTSVTINKPVRWDRYQIRVRSYTPTTSNDPGGIASDWGYGYATTRPVLTNVKYSFTYATSPDKRWTSVVGTPTTDFTPYFPVTGSPTVQYYYNSAMDTSTATAISLPWTNVTTVTGQSSNKPPNPASFYVIAKLTVTPSNNTGGAPSGPVTVWSNWVGPCTWNTSAASPQTGTATLAGW